MSAATTENLHDRPFFIIGSIHPGATQVRDVLRRHPNLAAPEETQFFRFAEPFGAPGSVKILSTNPTFRRHREMDGIDESEFQEMLLQSVSRADLYRRYMSLYIQKNKPQAKRWFDKSPQNVYGAAMIAMELPQAKFIHIVRNPFDVLSNLRSNKAIKNESLVGLCSSWNEAAEIIHVLKKAHSERVYEVRYEDLARDSLLELEKMLVFLGEDFDPAYFPGISMKRNEYDHDSLFSAEEKNTIARLCMRWGVKYGYFTADVLRVEIMASTCDECVSREG